MCTLCWQAEAAWRRRLEENLRCIEALELAVEDLKKYEPQGSTERLRHAEALALLMEALVAQLAAVEEVSCGPPPPPPGGRVGLCVCVGNG